jgi:hypothetical protein
VIKPLKVAMAAFASVGLAESLRALCSPAGQPGYEVGGGGRQTINCRNRLGGLLRHYYQDAA